MNESEKTIAAINNAMASYFEGLYLADTEVLARIFHPDARYVNMVEDDYMNKSLDEYFAVVDKRIPPSSTDEARVERIISVELGGKRMAFVKASMTMLGREYLDFLTFTLDPLGWRIMSKVFTYQPLTNFGELNNAGKEKR